MSFFFPQSCLAKMELSHILCEVESLQQADLLCPSKTTGPDDICDQDLGGADQEARIETTSHFVYHPSTHPILAAEKRGNATAHYKRYIDQCAYSSQCYLENSFELLLSFASMNEAVRVNTVRSMLPVLSASPDCPNSLMKSNARYAQSRKRVRRARDITARTSTRYAIKGVFICANVFAAIVQLHPRTVTEYATAISASSDFHPQKTNECNRRKGILSAQSILSISFLRRYGELNAMSCPTGRGSTTDTSVLFSSSSMTKTLVHTVYCGKWEGIMDAHCEESTSSHKRPIAPLTKPSFCKVWDNYVPTLRIMKAGSDFCDTCTKLENNASITDDLTVKSALLTSRSKHRQEAAREFYQYNSMQHSAKPTGTELHLVFNFAEKVLLPNLQRQPGQLHFVTGLKFDFFGVHISNLSSTNIYGLPEGHWPGGKTAS